MIELWKRNPFWAPLGLITLLGLAARVAWTLTHDITNNSFVVDQTFYHRVAESIASGDGFTIDGNPTVKKPPLYPLLLGVQSKLGFGSMESHRLLGALLGALLIVAIALLARKVAGDRVALIAALLAAVNPALWVLDSQLLSETLYGPLLVICLLLAYRLDDGPTWRTGALLGAIIGLAILTRPEAIVIGGLIAVGLLVRHRAWLPVAAGLGACLLVLAPWVVRNVTTFDKPVFISIQGGINFAGANCPGSYHGRDIGSWRFACITPPRPGEDEGRWAAGARRTGLRYAREHAGRFPVVALARIGRTWGVFNPRGSVGGDRLSGWREPAAAWVLLALAIAGVVVAVRRKLRIWILLVPAVTVTITAVVQFGLLRYRNSADLAFFVLAGIAIEAALARWWPRTRPDAPA